MSTSLEYIAATAEDAISKGLTALGLNRDQVDIEILDNGSKGLFGIGARHARVRLTVREESLRESMKSDVKPEAEPKAEPEAPAEPVPAPVKDEPKPEKKAEKPARKPEKKGDKPEKKADKPEKKDEKPEKKADKPEKKAEKPVKKAEKKPAEPKPSEGEGEEALSPEEVVNEETMEITANIVRDLLEKMHVDATVESRIGEAADEVDSRVILIDIQGDDLSYLIGRHSEVLQSLQYITSLIVGREVGHWVPIVLDVQGYRERRERQLRQMASRMAEQVVKTGRRISLEPMNATERRIIHLALRENPDVTTESIGEEPNRKVVIYPKEK